MGTFTKTSIGGGLCLTRKAGQSVTINHGELVIEIIQVKSNAVRIAFRANKEISIVRTEAIVVGKPNEKKP